MQSSVLCLISLMTFHTAFPAIIVSNASPLWTESLSLGPMEILDMAHNEADDPLITRVENLIPTHHRNVLHGSSSKLTLSRDKRQARDIALGLALNHQRSDGRDRQVGKPFGRVDLNAAGKGSRNFHAQGGVGLGSVLFRSKNNRHSVGAGAYVTQSRGRFQGHHYKSKPDAGVGLGYKFKF